MQFKPRFAAVLLPQKTAIIAWTQACLNET